MGTASPVETGQTLGRFTLIEKLGEGYLGPVWRGLDEVEGRPVVIRILCDGIKWGPEIEAAFRRECQALIALRHPNVAALYEIGRERGFQLIVMESLGSRNLETMITQKTAMTVESRLSVMIQAAEGLSHAHRNGVRHRNLEPSKIHVTADGTVKIRDFALAHVLKKHLPRPAVRWGAAIYLAPEQIENGLPDERSDIFALGTVFYEFLTGLHPFHDPNGNKALDNVLQPPQLPTFEEFPEIPPGTWAILKTCLALDPGDRYRSMQDVADAGRELLTSLADDTRLMLAELYAALPSLRRAAAQPGAPQSILRLLEAVQQLAQGEKEAHYACLDSLMTRLIEQYPVLQSSDVSCGPETAQMLDMPGAPAPLAEPVAVEPVEPVPAERVKPNSVEPSDPDTSEPAEAAAEPLEPSPEPVEPIPVEPIPVEPIPVEPIPVELTPELNTPQEEPLPETVPEAVHSRRFHPPAYRTTVVLLSILLITVAGFIAWRGGAPAAIQKTWGYFLEK